MNPRTTFAIALMCALAAAGLQGCGGAESRKARALERGGTYLAEGNYAKARVEFNNALQITPNDADARYYAAFATEKGGDLRAAAQGYQGALNVDATHALALAALGRLYVFSGLPQQALELVEKGIAVAPNHPELLVIRAAAQLSLGREDEAIADANAVLAQNRDHEYAVALLAGVERNRGNTAKALELLTGTLERVPTSVDLRSVLAQLYLDGGDNALAEVELKRIVAEQPAELRHRQRLVTFYASTGQPEAAEGVLRELIALDPKSTQHKLALINYIAAQKSFDAAEQELRAFVAASPKDHALQLAMGQFYEAHNLSAEAERIYREVMVADRLEAAGLAARNRLAALAIRANRAADAQPLIAEVLEENPRDNDALVLRASLALADNRALDAITDLRAVLRDQPDSAPLLRTLARAHAQNDEPDLAREQYRHAIEVDPSNTELHSEFADYLIRGGDNEEAQRLLEAVLETDPQNLVALELDYRALTAGGDAAAADVVAKKIVTAYPESPLGYYFQGLLLESGGDFAAALTSYQRSLEKMPRGAEPVGAIARVLVRAGKRDDVHTFLEDLIAKYPDHTVALNLYAELLLSEKELERAAAIADRAIEVDRSWWLPYRTKAYVQLARGAKDEAIGAYRAGLTATNNAPTLGMDLAAIYEREQQPESAIEIYELLHAANPGSAPLANNLAMLLSTYREDDESHQRAQDLVRGFRNSDNPAYLNTYGWVRYRQGQLDEAVTYLRRAATAVPGNALMHYHLGMALLASGEAAQARAELEKALQTQQAFPGRAAAEKALQSLPPTQG